MKHCSVRQPHVLESCEQTDIRQIHKALIRQKQLLWLQTSETQQFNRINNMFAVQCNIDDTLKYRVLAVLISCYGFCYGRERDLLCGRTALILMHVELIIVKHILS